MCYIGIDTEIPEKKFDKRNLEFCIERVENSEFDATTFTKKNIYYVGTSEGCGCKFGTLFIPDEIITAIKEKVKKGQAIPDNFRDYFEFEDTLEEIEETIEENKTYAEDTKKLYSLLEQLCGQNSDVEFFGCWAGKEKSKPDIISTTKFKSNDFFIDFHKIWDSNIFIRIAK